MVFGAFGVGREVVLCRGSPASGVAQAGNEEGGAECELLPSPLLRPSPPVPTCSTLARRPPAVAVAVCFEEKYSAVAGLVHAFGSWQRCVWGKTHRTTRKSWPAFLDQLD